MTNITFPAGTHSGQHIFGKLPTSICVISAAPYDVATAQALGSEVLSPVSDLPGVFLTQTIRTLHLQKASATAFTLMTPSGDAAWYGCSALTNSPHWRMVTLL